MKVTQLYIVRHLLIVTCSLIGVTLLAIGANAALDLRTSEAAKVVPVQETASARMIRLEEPCKHPALAVIVLNEAGSEIHREHVYRDPVRNLAA